MAETKFVTVQNSGLRPTQTLEQIRAKERTVLLSEWKAHISALDKQILEFDQNPKEKKWQVADNAISSLTDVFRTLNGVARGPFPDIAPGSAKLYTNDLPKNVSEVLTALAGQDRSNISSSPIAKMGNLLNRVQLRDIGASGNNWDTAESRALIQEAQKIWRETKPKLLQILADPNALESIRRVDDLRHMQENPAKFGEEKLKELFPPKKKPHDQKSLGKPLPD